MFEYSQEVWASKREKPTDDLASMLAHAALDDEELDAIDFFLWFLLLIDAGGDTTRNLVGGGMWALFERPDALEWLAEKPEERLSSAIEELLRWVSPVIYMRRTATRDVELHSQPIAARDKVIVYYGAANRDPRAFDRPDELDLSRSPNPHVAFGGGGPHFCLGAHLARIEIASLLGQMLSRLPGVRPAGPPAWMASNFIYGPTTLPVRFDS